MTITWSSVRSVLITLLCVAVFLLVNGFALQILWEWFVAPAGCFRKLTLPAAVGIVLVVDFLVPRLIPDYSSAKVDGKWFVGVLVRPLVALAFGWLIVQWAAW
jgi:hypothetical protein